MIIIVISIIIIVITIVVVLDIIIVIFITSIILNVTCVSYIYRWYCICMNDMLHSKMFIILITGVDILVSIPWSFAQIRFILMLREPF